MQHNVRTRAALSLGFKLILNVKEEGTTLWMSFYGIMNE
jgi:hypothetical protein